MNIEWRRFRSQGIREKLFTEVEGLILSDPKAALEKLAELKKMCVSELTGDRSRRSTFREVSDGFKDTWVCTLGSLLIRTARTTERYGSTFNEIFRKKWIRDCRNKKRGRPHYRDAHCLAGTYFFLAFFLAVGLEPSPNSLALLSRAFIAGAATAASAA